MWICNKSLNKILIVINLEVYVGNWLNKRSAEEKREEKWTQYTWFGIVRSHPYVHGQRMSDDLYYERQITIVCKCGTRILTCNTMKSHAFLNSKECIIHTTRALPRTPKSNQCRLCPNPSLPLQICKSIHNPDRTILAGSDFTMDYITKNSRYL